ncbi:MAG: hypothetical protein U1E59_18780 [Amaricoccus sp.]
MRYADTSATAASRSTTTPPSAPSAWSQSRGHSAHVGQDVEVCYRWHALHGRRVRCQYWYSTSASLNRIAADRASQLEEALVLLEIDKALSAYINALADRGHFDAVQVAPSGSSEVPDEPGGVRAVVLGVAHPHNGRDASEALAEAKEILLQRGNVPRVYRNMLVFLAAESRQLDSLKEGMRSSLAVVSRMWWKFRIGDLRAG